ENKKEFIGIQTKVPDLAKYHLSVSERKKAKEKSQKLLIELTEYLHKKNELALLRQELDEIETEYQHYQNAHAEYAENLFVFKRKITADDLLSLWVSIKKQALKSKDFNFLQKLIFRIKYGI